MRFADEKTQELFDELQNSVEKLAQTKTMTAHTIYYQKYLSVQKVFISHVEARIRREGEKCEWEKELVLVDRDDEYFSTTGCTASLISNKEWLKEMDHKFCPLCGRSLEAK